MYIPCACHLCRRNYGSVKKSIERDKRVSKGGDRILEKVSRSEARTKAVGKSKI